MPYGTSVQGGVVINNIFLDISIWPENCLKQCSNPLQ
jgi:hypothetical protein